MQDCCPTCGQTLSWKRPEDIQVKPRVKPKEETPEELAAKIEAKRRSDLKHMRNNARACVCWLCNAHISIRKYADHMQRHRDENWVPRTPKTSKSRAEVFAEWGQEEAQ